MLGVSLPIIAPIFICVGIGWLWAKRGRPMDVKTVNMLVTNLGAPALVFSSLVRLSTTDEVLGQMALASLLALLVFAVVGAIVLRMGRLSQATYLPSLVFTNCGNMGLPLSLFAFGEIGLEYAAVFFAISMTTMMLLGNWLISGEPTPRKALASPLPYAVIAAIGLRAAGWPAPAWIYNTTVLLGGMTVPLMLLTLGVSLASMRVGQMRRALGLAIFRLAMGVAVGFALAEAMGFTGALRGVLIIQCAMPAAVFNYLFAQSHGRHPEETASVIVLSTLVSFLTLPLLLRFVLV